MAHEVITVDRLPPPDVTLPIVGHAARPEPALVAQLHSLTSAAASDALHRMGLRRAAIQGPQSRAPGARVVAPAVTLQFMPLREDVLAGWGRADAEPSSALWALLDALHRGDVLVAQASGDRACGCLGLALATALIERGAAGVVLDGCVREWARLQPLGLPIWALGTAPAAVTHAGLFPWAYNVPVACGGALVLPGDIVVADDDGAVVIPAQLAPEVARITAG